MREDGIDWLEKTNGLTPERLAQTLEGLDETQADANRKGLADHSERDVEAHDDDVEDDADEYAAWLLET